MAGGDGTQALWAGIAAGRDIPMMVISAGTRNHFALDLGLDCDDPSTCLDALSDGVKIASAAQAAGLLSAHLHAKPRAAANIQLADRAGLSHIPEQRDHDERLLKALS